MGILLKCITLALIVSCVPDGEEPAPEPVSPEFYIKAKFAGDSVTFSNELEPPSDGAYFETDEGDPLNKPLLYIIKFEKTEFTGNYISLEIARFHLDTITIPYEVPQSPAFQAPYFGITFGNSATENILADDDNTTYYGNTLSGADIDMSITAFKDDIIEGEFSGKLQTKTGLVLKLESGQFRSKIYRRN